MNKKIRKKKKQYKLQNSIHYFLISIFIKILNFNKHFLYCSYYSEKILVLIKCFFLF